MAGKVYLYTGPEFGERDEAVLKIKADLSKKFGIIDEHLFYLMETPFAQAMTILQSGTLFSDGVCVVCKNAELLKKKDDLETLSSWIESETSESNVLILISDEISVDTKLDKIIPANNKKKFWEMFDEKKIPWLKDYFRKNGYSIKEDACQLILDMVENNTQSLKNECSRFFLCFPKDHVIVIEDVEAVLSDNREESVFTLFNQISNPDESPEKRFENALSILQKIRLSKDSSSVAIIAGFSSCFRKLFLWEKINSGSAADDFTLTKNGFASKLMQKQYRNAAKIWTIGQTTAILSLLAATDMEIRSSGALFEDVMLQKMLYEIIIKKGASISTAEY